MNFPTRHHLLAMGVFLVAGVIKLPIEQHLSREMRQSGTLQAPVAASLRENLGQMAFAASLGGLRSLVASVVYLQAFTAFERNNWAQVESLSRLTTQLQPRYPNYWDDAASRIVYDAGSYYLYEESRPSLYRRQLYRQQVATGTSIAEEGARHLPESPILHRRLGEIYSRMMASAVQKELVPPDHAKAAYHYLEAAKYGALPWVQRAAAYELAKLENAPEQWRLSYQILRAGYDRGLRLPSAITTMKTLEERLSIPREQRIP